MKRLLTIICCVCLIATLCGCEADVLNDAINSAASKAGADVKVNIKQEQVDAIEGSIKDGAQKAKDILSDEKVKGSLKDAFDAAAEHLDESEEEIESESAEE